MLMNFLHRGRILNEEGSAVAMIINQSVGNGLCLVTEQEMKVWISVIHEVWSETGLQSSVAHLCPVQEVPPASLPSLVWKLGI